MGEKKVIHEGSFLSYVCQDNWEYVERVGCSGIVVIVALTGEEKLILVEQYRLPVDRHVIELPAGLMGDRKEISGENWQQAAKRELLEETGYEAENFFKLGEGPACCGMSSTLITFVQASGLCQVASGGGDETEKITVHEVALNQLEDWLAEMEKNNRLIEPKIYSGLYLLNKYNKNFKDKAI